MTECTLRGCSRRLPRLSDDVTAVTLKRSALPNARLRQRSMTVASHKRVRVVSACDVTVPASAVPPPADLATDCGANIDAGSDGAGSATDDRGDDFPGAWSGTDSVLDLAQPLSAPGALGRPRLGVVRAPGLPAAPGPRRSPGGLNTPQTPSAGYGPTPCCSAPVTGRQR